MSTISNNTKVQLGMVLLFLGGVISLVWFGAQVKFSQEAQDKRLLAVEDRTERQGAAIVKAQADTTEAISVLRNAIDKAYDSRKAEAAKNAYKMAIDNPGLKVPDPDNPGEVIVVEGKAK